MENHTFDFNGFTINFKFGSQIFINSSEMAIPFGKSLSDWLNLKSTQSYINLLLKFRSPDISSELTSGLSETTTDKTRKWEARGTWIHSDIAEEFARWISLDFYFWLRQKTRDLVKSTIVRKSIDTEEWDTNFEPKFSIAGFEVDKNSDERMRVVVTNSKINLVPFQNTNLYSMKDLGNKLNLKEEIVWLLSEYWDIIYFDDIVNRMKPEFENKGFYVNILEPISEEGNEGFTDKAEIVFYWTKKGLDFVANLIKEKMRA